MKLIEYDGAEIKIADEALLVRPNRELFRQDKTKNKEMFLRQMSYMWFMCDPRSSYMYIIDETERAEEVKKQEGFCEDWAPSKTLYDAMEIYKRQTTTTASLMLDDMRYGMECIRALIRKVGRAMSSDDSGTDEDGGGLPMKLDKALDSMTKAVDKIPDLARKLIEAEKALAKDFATDDKTRGSAQAAIGEDV